MDRAQNLTNSRERRHFSPQQKVAIVKEHLVDGVPISDLCDRYHLQPTQFYPNFPSRGRNRQIESFFGMLGRRRLTQVIMRWTVDDCPRLSRFAQAV